MANIRLISRVRNLCNLQFEIFCESLFASMLQKLHFEEADTYYAVRDCEVSNIQSLCNFHMYVFRQISKSGKRIICTNIT